MAARLIAARVASRLVSSSALTPAARTFTVSALRLVQVDKFSSFSSPPSTSKAPPPSSSSSPLKNADLEFEREVKEACGPLPGADGKEEEEEEMEEMFVEGPMGREWGGPTRGGRLQEPTIHGDWQRKGRCSDF